MNFSSEDSLRNQRKVVGGEISLLFTSAPEYSLTSVFSYKQKKI